MIGVFGIWVYVSVFLCDRVSLGDGFVCVSGGVTSVVLGIHVCVLWFASGVLY